MSDILYNPPASGNGGQNPTPNYIPLNNGTSNFIDSNIFNDFNNILYTIFNGSRRGLKIDYPNQSYYLGDFDYNYNNTTLIVDDNVEKIRTTQAGGDIGLNLDFNNGFYYFGDFNGINNKTVLKIIDFNKSIFLGSLDGDNTGFNYYRIADTNQNSCWLGLGDLADQYGFYFQITDTPTNDFLIVNSNFNAGIYSQNNGHLELTSYGTNNNTILLDPFSDKITFATNALNYIGTSLTDGAAVTPVGKNLLVTINGAQYHIPLYN